MKTDFSGTVFEKRTTAPIIFSLLIAIIVGLQFVPGYFQCSYSTDTKVYNKSYFDLVGATDAASIITFILWALLIAILVIIWDRTKKNKEYINSILVCTAAAFLLLLVCSFLGSSGYYDTFPFFDYYYSRYFDRFYLLFYVEIILFVIMLCCEAIMYRKSAIKKKADNNTANYTIPEDMLSDRKQAQSGTANQDTESALDRLEKLSKLHDSGVLTDDEFLEQKEKLLNQL